MFERRSEESNDMEGRSVEWETDVTGTEPYKVLSKYPYKVPLNPDQLLGPPSLLYSGYRRSFPGAKASTHLWNVGRQLFYTAVHPRRQFGTSKIYLFNICIYIVCYWRTLLDYLVLTVWGVSQRWNPIRGLGCCLIRHVAHFNGDRSCRSKCTEQILRQCHFAPVNSTGIFCVCALDMAVWRQTTLHIVR
jgi:hypothetical protein